MKREKIISVIFVHFLVTLLAVCVGQEASIKKGMAAEPYIMRIGYPTGGKHPENMEMGEFKRQVEEKMGTRLKVELYGLSKLGNPSQMLQGLQSGTIQGIIMPPAFYGGMIPAVTIADLPGLFRNVEIAYKVMNSPAAKGLADITKSKGALTLGWFYSANKDIISKFPIMKMSDLRGKKIRTMASPVMQEQINKLGAAAVPIAPGEVYTSMQQGTVDGCFADCHFWYTMRLYEVAKYRVEAPQGGQLSVFVAGARWLDSLPMDLRQVVIDTAKDVIPFGAKYAQGVFDEAIRALESAGGKTTKISPEFEKELAVMSKEVTNWFLKEYPEAKPIYNSLVKAPTQ
jgi:C4-dicarboxylate-binding protein DctP